MPGPRFARNFATGLAGSLGSSSSTSTSPKWRLTILAPSTASAPPPPPPGRGGGPGGPEKTAVPGCSSAGRCRNGGEQDLCTEKNGLLRGGEDLWKWGTSWEPKR